VSPVGRLRAGAALVARGEFSIVIAGLALTSGTLNPGLAPLATAYVLIMAVVGPVLARVMDPLARALFRRRAASGSGP
jgi:CPA2 family monovalent cation:H+ antiporter-2